ncbi:MAG: rhomboid family intramembrane serine protease, partial [Bauldia sp.]|nr:rhomboid family intramembrane serine protease [Bauldia sp.]
MVFSITSLASGAANNLLVLLGAAFVLSRGLAVLAGRPARARTAWMGLAFAATAIASIMVSFPIAPGVIGDLRNAVIAIAALTGGPVAADTFHALWAEGRGLRLFTALFLHADWAHLLGNLVFLLIFGLPAERAMGPWRFLALFLLGGAV